MIGHLGARVSALLDGQLTPGETDDAWAHVYACHQCRDLVEREGWVKTRLAGLADGCDPSRASAPSALMGSLLSLTPGESFLAASHASAQRRALPVGAAFVGGGALGVVLLGVLALGVLPGTTPADRRPPVTRIDTTVSDPVDGSSASPEGVSGPASETARRVAAPTTVSTVPAVVWTFFE